MVAGLVDLSWESSNLRIPQTLKEGCKFTLRWLRDLGNTSLEQNLRLNTLGYLLFILAILFTCCLDAQWLTFGCYWRNCHSPDANHFASRLSIFDSKVTQRGWVSTLNWVRVGVDHNGITHLATHPKSQKILSSDLHSDFLKCGNAPNTQNSYSLPLWWPLGLYNTSLDARFSVQNFSFCWSIKSTS